MDYSELKIPYIKNELIKTKVESFRNKYWNREFPINIEKIIDVKLKINIIPIPNLEKICNTDTLITSDWESLYVDDNLYNDERRQNRLRFSLAHEIGHYILHKEFYSTWKINSIEKFYSFLDLIPREQYSYLETQANKFATYFLVPRQALEERFKIEYKNVEKIKNFGNIDINTLKSYIANPLSNFFGVSPESIEIALSDLEFFKNQTQIKQ